MESRNEPGMPFGRSRWGSALPVMDSQRGAGSWLAIVVFVGCFEEKDEMKFELTGEVRSVAFGASFPASALAALPQP